MTDLVERCDVHFEPVTGGGASGYGLGRVAGAASDTLATGTRVLAPQRADGAEIQSVESAACVPVPDAADVRLLLELPRLALALWAWDRIGLELGEGAAVCGDTWLAGPFCRVARWRSARTPALLGSGPADDVIAIAVHDPQRAIDALKSHLQAAPGAAVAMLGQDARAVDIVLEALPSWGRIVLAAATTEPTAVDFYNHVHRKGARIACVPASPAELFEAGTRASAAPYWRQARRILDRNVPAR